MRTIGSFLLCLLGISGMIFNRFAAEEGMKWWPPWWRKDASKVLFARVVAFAGGAALGLIGLLMTLGYLQ